jgi:hypothetical protein
VNQSAQTNPDRWKSLVLVLTLVNTVLMASVSALQVDANIRANQANRDAQYYAVQITGGLAYTGARGDFDTNTYAISVTNTLESLVAGYTALLRQEVNDTQGYDALKLEEQIYQARADRATSLSVLQTNPAYGHGTTQTAADFTAYFDELFAPTREILQKQNNASDAYHHWNSKSDSYVAVLTVLAVAFFLLGVAQMTRPGLRLLFSIFAVVVLGIGSLWTLILLVF